MGQLVFLAMIPSCEMVADRLAASYPPKTERQGHIECVSLQVSGSSGNCVSLIRTAWAVRRHYGSREGYDFTSGANWTLRRTSYSCRHCSRSRSYRSWLEFRQLPKVDTAGRRYAYDNTPVLRKNR